MNETKFNINDISGKEFRRLFIPVSYQLQLYILPFFLAVGILGNPISFAVWISRKVRRNNSSAIYMAMLSFNDFFVIMLNIIYYLTTTLGLSILDFASICKIYHHAYLFFQYNSLPLVFGFTLERWIAVCYPFRREQWCTENRAWMACGLIFVTVFLCTLPENFLWYHIPNCQFLIELRNNSFVIFYQTTLESLMGILIPILTLGLNIRVITEVYRISEHDTNGLKLVQKNQNSDSSIEKTRRETKTLNNSQNNTISFRSTTTTLLIVSFFHILTTLPVGIMYIGQNFINEGNTSLSMKNIKEDPTWKKHFQFHLVKDIIDILSVLHYCFNIVFYLASSQQFRSRLLLFLRMIPTLESEINNSTNNSYCKLRLSQDVNKTETSIRRQTVGSKKKSILQVLPDDV